MTPEEIEKAKKAMQRLGIAPQKTKKKLTPVYESNIERAKANYKRRKRRKEAEYIESYIKAPLTSPRRVYRVRIQKYYTNHSSPEFDTLEEALAYREDILKKYEDISKTGKNSR